MTGSTRRKQKETGWGPPRKDETGKKVCRRCAGDIPKGRRTFCGQQCIHEWRLRTVASYVRHKVFERDKGLCAICGTDTISKDKCVRPRAQGTGHLWQADHIVPVVEGGGECDLSNFRTLCTACHKSETAKLRKRMADARKTVPPLFQEIV